MSSRFYALLLLALCGISLSSSQTSLRTNPSTWSTAEECNRECQDGEEPKTCYYHFVLEYFTTMGGACNACHPNITNQLTGTPLCECIIGDGYEKTVFSFNRMIPGPSIQVCKNDYVIIDIENKAEGLEASIHWHGVFQNGYQYYDGVPYVTQCPILSGNTFRYQFQLKNSGTHFYHSHISVHMMDGQFGSLIVRDPPSENPHYALYDADYPWHVILICDWMHYLSIEKFPGLLHYHRGQTGENILINGKGDYKDPNTGKSTNAPIETIVVKKGKRYRMRIINSFSSVCPIEITIQNHGMLIIAQDGTNVQPVEIDGLISETGERYDFVLHANQSVDAYWIQVRGLGECGDKKIQQVAILKYEGGPDTPTTPKPKYDEGTSPTVLLNAQEKSVQCDEKDPNNICISQLKTADPVKKILYKVNPDYRLILPFNFYSYAHDMEDLLGPGSYRKFFVAVDKEHMVSRVANISFDEPSSPLISQPEAYEKMCKHSTEPDTCTEPCTCANVYHIRLGSVVELVVYDQKKQPGLYHPFHLHGYAFTVLNITQLPGSSISPSEIDDVLETHTYALLNGEYKNCPEKDTLVVPNGGVIIVRFVADNPGWWFFHCHFTWHTASGMNVVLHVGTPEDLPPVPPGFPKCYNWTPSPGESNVG